MPSAPGEVTGAPLGNEQGSSPCPGIVSVGSSLPSDMHFTINELGSGWYLETKVEELRAVEEPGQRGLS